MRPALRFWGICAVSLVAIACGGKKEEAKDPTDAPPASGDDTPKWEGTTSEDRDMNTRKPAPTTGGTAPAAENKRRADQYDKEGTEVSLKRAARQVHDNCGQAKDDNGKAIGPWGKVTIQVQLGANGHTKGTTVPPPYAGKPVATCIDRSFTNLSFPPWSGGDMQVDWEVELVEPGKEGKK